MATIICEIRSGARAGNPTRGYVIGYEPRECTAIRAERYEGRGDGGIHYFALTVTGEWLAFRKADNRRLKLPVARQLTWSAPVADAQHRHGPYGIYPGAIYRSEPIEMPVRATTPSSQTA